MKTLAIRCGTLVPDTPEAGLPTADAESFRRGMRSLAGAVCVIATGVPGRRAGLTATAVCSVTAEPPRLLVCLNKGTGTHASVTNNGCLSINVLGADQIEIARKFAGLVPGLAGDDRFIGNAWLESGGVPRLADAAANFVCRIGERIEQSSHTILLCDVEEVHTSRITGRRPGPLLYFEGHFRHLSPMRGAEQPLIEWLW